MNINLRNLAARIASVRPRASAEDMRMQAVLVAKKAQAKYASSEESPLAAYAEGVSAALGWAYFGDKSPFDDTAQHH